MLPFNPSVNTVVMPQVYDLSFHLWRWCRLTDVCAIVPDLAARVGVEFTPTPELLVSRFAPLVKPCTTCIGEEVLTPNGCERPKGRKLFRYSLNGDAIHAVEVLDGRSGPPYTPFRLDLDLPYPEDLFVPEGWVIDTLKCVGRGAVAAVYRFDKGWGICLPTISQMGMGSPWPLLDDPDHYRLVSVDGRHFSFECRSRLPDFASSTAA